MRQNKNVYAIGIQRVNLFTSLYSNFAIVLLIPVKINLANFNRSFFTVLVCLFRDVLKFSLGIFQGCIAVYLSRYCAVHRTALHPKANAFKCALTVSNTVNGEGGIWTLAPLLTTCTLSRGVPSASWVLLHSPELSQYCWSNHMTAEKYLQRRGWDSNPCALADKRFSRPPRYDHFDTSPWRPSSD